jgi:PAS domain S-box-containing protein
LAVGLHADSQDCVKVLDPEARVISINAAGCRILEIDDASRLIGQSWIELWAGADLHIAKAAIIRAARGETVTFVAFGYTFRNRGRLWQNHVTPLFGPDGKLREFVIVSRDITDPRSLVAP